MKDQFNNRISIEILVSGRPLEAHLVAITNLSDEAITDSINKIIEENKISYEDIKPPRSKDQYKISMKTKHLIERKLEDIGIEIYIFGFLITTGVGE